MSDLKQETFVEICNSLSFISFLYGTTQLVRDREEIDDYVDSKLPKEVFFKKNYIGRQYGVMPMRYWEKAIYEDSPETADKIFN